jgi:hypothetical protein
MCRDWYVPEPSVAKTQMTCGKACRLLRRGAQQKALREANVAAVRALDRARKRKQRARKAVAKGVGPPMSRAGLSADICASIEEFIDKLGHAQRMSRAGLRRALHRFCLGEKGRAEVQPERLET